MIRGGGKQKGAQYERSVCWDLSRFIDPEGTETLFWRNAMSGGRATLHNKKGIKNTKQLGDIACLDERGAWLTPLTFIIECKFYNSLDIETGLLSGKGRLAKFWRELCGLAKRHDRSPMLIARQNRTEPLVITDPKGMQQFRTFGHSMNPIVTSGMLGRSEALICLYKEVFKS